MTRPTEWTTLNHANFDRPVVDETPPKDRNNGQQLRLYAVLALLAFWMGLVTWTVAECRGVYAERME